MRVVNGLVILASAAVLAACATSGSEPPTIRAEPAKAAAPTPTEKVTIPYGYQTVMMNGEPMYCRNDVDTGSRVARTKVCLTAAQLKASQDNSQDFMNSVQRNGAAASATGTPGMGH